MISAAAKNHRFVAVVVTPESYDAVLAELQESGGEISVETRHWLANEAFALTARYDAAISRWFGLRYEAYPSHWVPAYEKFLDLSYGENPHQQAALYIGGWRPHARALAVAQAHGRELWFNNVLDLDAARRLLAEFDRPACVIVKHNNPCGVAIAEEIGDHAPRLLGDAGHEVALELLQHRAHLEVGRHRGDGRAHLGRADRLADVGAADRARVGASGSVPISRGRSRAARRPRRCRRGRPPRSRHHQVSGPVHRAGVEVADAEPRAPRPARRCDLPEPDGPSIGDDVRACGHGPVSLVAASAVQRASPGARAPGRARRRRRARRRPRRARTAARARARGAGPRC